MRLRPWIREPGEGSVSKKSRCRCCVEWTTLAVPADRALRDQIRMHRDATPCTKGSPDAVNVNMERACGAGFAGTGDFVNGSSKRGASPSADSLAEQTVYTVGHSTRSSDELLDLLETAGIEVVADVRRMPGSRRLPQFDSAVLARSLARREIDYCWIPGLGGRRRSTSTSRNTGWRHAAFRAYADHMDTEEFADGLFELLMLARGRRTVVMCAEVLWWRCHRRLIADVLVVLGLHVVHILAPGKQEAHRLAPPARLVRGELSYVGLTDK